MLQSVCFLVVVILFGPLGYSIMESADGTTSISGGDSSTRVSTPRDMKDVDDDVIDKGKKKKSLAQRQALFLTTFLSMNF